MLGLSYRIFFNDLLSTDRHQTELSQQDEDYFHTGDLYRTGVCSPGSSCILILVQHLVCVSNIID